MSPDIADRSDHFLVREIGEGLEQCTSARDLVQYHIHVNCFSDTPPASLLGRAAGRRMDISHCRFFGDEEPRSLWILTAKTARAVDADALYAKLVDLLGNDRTMRGYVECEAVNLAKVRRYPVSGYRPKCAFPGFDLRMAPGRRVADIHVFRELASPDDALDSALASAGFYKVTSERERIWTLLAGEMDCAMRIFEALHTHFSISGGISKLELEVVRALMPSPADFQLGLVCIPA